MLVHKDFVLSGHPNAISAFCEDLIESIDARWSAQKRDEPGVKGTYYAFSRTADSTTPAATLSLLLKPTAEQIKVVNVVPNSAGELSVTEYNRIVDDFVTDATPIAHRHDLEAEITSAHADLSRWASPTVAQALRTFSSLANKSTGHGHPMDHDRWARFVILAHRENSSLDSTTLERYLVEELGWDETMAERLGSSYESFRAILKANDEFYE